MKAGGAPSRWPSHCRIYRLLRDSATPLDVQSIAAQAFCAIHTAHHAITDLRAMGLIHIRSWRRTVGGNGGHPAALWAFGYGKDKPKPKAFTMPECRIRHYHKRKNEIIDKHGLAVWRRVNRSRLEGGADKIVIDGQTVFQRKAPAIQRKGREA